MFQGFHWESHRHPWYQELAAKAGDLAECGFTTVWLPPPTESVAPQGMPLRLTRPFDRRSYIEPSFASIHLSRVVMLFGVSEAY